MKPVSYCAWVFDRVCKTQYTGLFHCCYHQETCHEKCCAAIIRVHACKQEIAGSRLQEKSSNEMKQRMEKATNAPKEQAAQLVSHLEAECIADHSIREACTYAQEALDRITTSTAEQEHFFFNKFGLLEGGRANRSSTS